MLRYAVAAAAIAQIAVPLPLIAQQDPNAVVLTGAAAFGDWRSDKPGIRRLIRPEDLPDPFASKSSSNGPGTAPLPKAPALHVPAGFAVTLWAQGLDGPREMKVAPNGDVFVVESGAGTLRVLRATADGKVSARAYASGLDGPFGMAFYPPVGEPQWLYVATTNAVLRFPYRTGDLVASARPELVTELDISEGGHSTRDIAFTADGKRMFVSIGSQTNDAEHMHLLEGAGPELPEGMAWGEEERRADVLVFDSQGKNGRVFATGIRNCVGLAIAPANADLYCATNERDGLGDNLPPDYVTRVRDGGFYGWPWFYIGNHADPRHKGERLDLADRVAVPDVLIQAHSAPLSMTFYTSTDGAPSGFPPAYRDSAFVALHGSWNRAQRTGYKVVMIIMENGGPTGAYEDFLTGFVNQDGSVWGRPVGVAVAKDGALLVSEDANGSIWRIAPVAPP